jgi:hypothetical protein
MDVREKRDLLVLLLSVTTQEQFVVSQTFKVPSLDPEAIKLPSSEKHMQATPREWESGLSYNSVVHSFTVLPPADAMRVASGEKHADFISSPWAAGLVRQTSRDKSQI